MPTTFFSWQCIITCIVCTGKHVYFLVFCICYGISTMWCLASFLFTGAQLYIDGLVQYFSIDLAMRILQSCTKSSIHHTGIILTHWGRVTHICVGKLTIIGSDNHLSPGRRQAIIWSNAGILLIGPLETNFSYILIAIETFSFKKMHLKISSAKWRPFCLGLNVLSAGRPLRDATK